MTTRVLVALAPDVEGHVVTAFEQARDLTVVRRCPDLADLLAAAGAGLGDCAVISAALRGLDRDAVARLDAHGLVVLGVVPDHAEHEDRMLRQLGVEHVVPATASGADLAEAVAAAVCAPMDGADHVSGPGHLGTETDLDPADDLPHGRIVAVWGPAGAPGRTTLAVTVAAELAESGQRALLIDADTWGASVAQSLALVDEAPGLVAAARASEQGRLDRATLAGFAPVVGHGLRVLTGLPKPERWPELRSAALEQILALARTLADVVVVDCGFSLEDDEELSYDTQAPRRNATTLTTLAEADEVLVIGSADPVGLQRLVRGVQELAVIAAPPPRVVVNKVRSTAVGAHPERQIAAALDRFSGLDDLTFLPWAGAECDGAMLAGDPLTRHAPRSALRLAIRELAGSLGPTPVGAAPDPTRRLSRWGRG